MGLTAISARPNAALTTFASWTDPGHPGLSEKSREREEMEREDIGAIEQLASKKCDVGDNALPTVLQFEAPPMLKQSQCWRLICDYRILCHDMSVLQESMSQKSNMK